MQSGDIVGINPVTRLVRPSLAADKLVGVVSTQPGVIGNSAIKNGRSTLVALIEQVPFNDRSTLIEGNIVKTTDGLQIGYRLASGYLYLQISSTDKKLAEIEGDLNQIKRRSLQADKHDHRLLLLERENQAMRQYLCGHDNSDPFCESE